MYFILSSEIILTCTAFSFLFLYFIKRFNFKLIYFSNWTFFFIMLFCSFLSILNVLTNMFDNSFTFYINPFFHISKGILEFKSLILIFNFFFLYNFATTTIPQKNIELFFFNIIFYLISNLLLISSNNFFLIFLCIELQNFITYILISIAKTRQTSIKSLFMYLILNSLIAIFFIFSLIIFYSIFKTLILTDIKILLFSDFFQISNLLNKFLIIALILNLITLFFKLASAPFHFWVKDIYSGIPMSLFGFFNINTKLILFFLIFKILGIFKFFIETQYMFFFQCFFFIFGTLSIIIGSLLTIYQKTVKTFLICSSISHIGYLILTLISFNNIYTITSILSYLFNYVFTLIIIWGIFSYLFELTLQNDYYLNELLNYFKYTPVLGVLFCVCLLSLAGIPPFLGFFFKYNLLLSLIISQNLTILFLILIMSLISSFYYLLLIKLLFFEFTAVLNYKFIFSFVKTKFQYLFGFGLIIYLILSPFFFKIVINNFYLLTFFLFIN